MKLGYEACYKQMIREVLQRGQRRETRAGKTRQVFSAVITFDELPHGQLPVLTSRKMFYRPVLGELAAFLRGATTLQEFKDLGCNYWDANAENWSENYGMDKQDMVVGNVYGAKWRDFNGIDQLERLLDRLKNDAGSRRHIITAYDPSEDYHCLPPCHLMAQFNVGNDDSLSVCVYMRSVDLVLGLPADVLLYSTLLLLVAQETGYKPGRVTFMLADTHVYEQHVPLLPDYLFAREYELPGWILDGDATVDNFLPDDLELVHYQHGERIDFPFNV